MDLPHVPSERGSTVSSHMSEHQEKRLKTRLFDKIRESRLKNRLLHSSAQLTTNRSISKQTWDRGCGLPISLSLILPAFTLLPYKIAEQKAKYQTTKARYQKGVCHGAVPH